MRVYCGVRTRQGVEVWVEEGDTRYPLDPRLDIECRSPTGFEWGYRGSGPAQLALAILADLTDKETALRFYQAFKEEVIAGLPRQAWVLSGQDVLFWLEGKRRLLGSTGSVDVEAGSS